MNGSRLPRDLATQIAFTAVAWSLLLASFVAPSDAGKAVLALAAFAVLAFFLLRDAWRFGKRS